MVEHIIAPLLITVDDDFSIRSGTENVAISFQLLLQLRIIIDLAVKDNPDRLFPIGHRLVPALEINNGEPSKAEAKRPGQVVPLIIRPPVDHRVRHAFNCFALDGFQALKVVLSADAAHGFLSYEVRVASYGLVTGYGLRVTSYGLRLRVTSCELRVVSSTVCRHIG